MLAQISNNWSSSAIVHIYFTIFDISNWGYNEVCNGKTMGKTKYSIIELSIISISSPKLYWGKPEINLLVINLTSKEMSKHFSS